MGWYLVDALVLLKRKLRDPAKGIFRVPICCILLALLLGGKITTYAGIVVAQRAVCV